MQKINILKIRVGSLSRPQINDVTKEDKIFTVIYSFLNRIQLEK